MVLNSGSAGFAASVAATWAVVSTVCSSRTWQVAHERPFVPGNAVSNSASPSGGQFFFERASATGLVATSSAGALQAPSASNEKTGNAPSVRRRGKGVRDPTRDDTPDERDLNTM